MLQSASDLCHMPQIGATASAEDVEPRHAVGERAILLCKLVRTTRIEFGRRIEFFGHLVGVGLDLPDYVKARG